MLLLMLHAAAIVDDCIAIQTKMLLLQILFTSYIRGNILKLLLAVSPKTGTRCKIQSGVLGRLIFIDYVLNC